MFFSFFRKFYFFIFFFLIAVIPFAHSQTACAVYENAASALPSDIEAWSSWAACEAKIAEESSDPKLKEEHIKKQFQIYNQAVRANPKSVFLLVEWAKALNVRASDKDLSTLDKSKFYKEASGLLEKASNLDAADPELWETWAHSFKMLAEFAEYHELREQYLKESFKRSVEAENLRAALEKRTVAELVCSSKYLDAFKYKNDSQRWFGLALCLEDEAKKGYDFSRYAEITLKASDAFYKSASLEPNDKIMFAWGKSLFSLACRLDFSSSIGKENFQKILSAYELGAGLGQSPVWQHWSDAGHGLAEARNNISSSKAWCSFGEKLEVVINDLERQRDLDTYDTLQVQHDIWRLAHNAFERASQLSPSYIRAWEGRARTVMAEYEAYSKFGEPSMLPVYLLRDAADSYRQIYELDPSDNMAFFNSRKLLFEFARNYGHNFQKFFLLNFLDNEYSELAKSAPHSADIYADWGEISLLMADITKTPSEISIRMSEGNEHFEQALELSPGSVVILGNWGRLLSAIGDNAGKDKKIRLEALLQAGDKYKQIVELHPDAKDAWYYLGHVLYKTALLKEQDRGLFESSRNALEKSLQLGGETVFSELRYELDSVVKALNDFDKPVELAGNSSSPATASLPLTESDFLEFCFPVKEFEVKSEYSIVCRELLTESIGREENRLSSIGSEKQAQVNALYALGNYRFSLAWFAADESERQKLFVKAQEDFLKALKLLPSSEVVWKGWSLVVSELIKKSQDSLASIEFYFAPMHSDIDLSADANSFKYWKLSVKALLDVFKDNPEFAYNIAAQAVVVSEFYAEKKLEDPATILNLASDLYELAALSVDAEERQGLVDRASMEVERSLKVESRKEAWDLWKRIFSDQNSLMAGVSVRKQRQLQALNRFKQLAFSYQNTTLFLENWGNALIELASVSRLEKDKENLIKQALGVRGELNKIAANDFSSILRWSKSLERAGGLVNSLHLKGEIIAQVAEMSQQMADLIPDNSNYWLKAADALSVWAVGINDVNKQKEVMLKAEEAYRKAYDLSPESGEVLASWGVSLLAFSDLAINKNDKTKQLKLKSEAVDKFSESVTFSILYDLPEVYENWGYALVGLSSLADSPQQRFALDDAACSKFQVVQDILDMGVFYPVDLNLLIVWSETLLDMAQYAESSEQKIKFIDAACFKLEEAIWRYGELENKSGYTEQQIYDAWAEVMSVDSQFALSAQERQILRDKAAERYKKIITLDLGIADDKHFFFSKYLVF